MLKVQSGQSGAKTLYAVFDRTLLDHRTPFVARRTKAGSVEVSTLNTQVAVPGELRFVAYESPKDLPQPYRDKVMGIQVAKHAPAAATTQPRASVPIETPTKSAKTPRTDPVRVQITYKQLRPDSVKPKAKRPVAQEALKPSAVMAVIEPRPKRQLAQQTTEARDRRRFADALKPMTNMALAFQRLAQSDPDAEQLLITGFREPPKKPQ